MFVALPLNTLAKDESKARIRVTLSQDKLLLGVEKSLDVTMHLPRNRELTKFNFQSLLGTVSDIHVTKNGRKVRALYTPPNQFFPSVDLVVVSASDGKTTFWGFATVKLIGQGKAKIETTPEATTHLRIGNKKFGPATADENGEAFVDVQVPPGVMFGVDDEGNEVPLHLPQGPTTAIFAARGPQINMDETSEADLLLVFWTPDGKADKQPENPTVVAASGDLSPVKKMSKGIFRMTYTVPEKPGTVNFTIYNDEEQAVRTQYLEMVGTEDFSETAVTIEKKKEKKAPEKKKTIPEKKPLPPMLGASRIFVTAMGGLSTDFGDWVDFSAKLGVSFRLPAKPLMGVGIQIGIMKDTTEKHFVDGEDDGNIIVADNYFTMKLLLFPVTATFWYRHPLRPGWYMTPGIELGAAIIYNREEIMAAARGFQPGAVFIGAASLGIERELGPGMVVLQLSAAHLRGNTLLLEAKQSGMTSMEALLGYRMVFGRPPRLNQ